MARPTMFTDESVRAILAGRKTQTRRLLADNWKPMVERIWMAQHHTHAEEFSPYGQPGDVVRVREAWRTLERDTYDGILYRADDAFVRIANTARAAEAWVGAHDNDAHGEDWRPSLFMPGWATRLFLRIKQVRVERLQDITEADAQAEGVSPYWCVPITERAADIQRLGRAVAGNEPGSYVTGYQFAWDEINGDRALWAENPWVFVVVFEVAELLTQALACPGPCPGEGH